MSNPQLATSILPLDSEYMPSITKPDPPVNPLAYNTLNSSSSTASIASTSSVDSTSSSSLPASTKKDERPFLELSGYDKMIRVGETLLYGIDRIGEKVCDVLGITQSKYQYVIDAQDRRKFWAEMKRKIEEEERQAELEAMRAAGVDVDSDPQEHHIELSPSATDSSAQAVQVAIPKRAPPQPVQSQLPANITAFASAAAPSQ